MAQIYLISPPQIELKDFSLKLEKALKTGLVPSFQLRLKNYSPLEIKKFSFLKNFLFSQHHYQPQNNFELLLAKHNILQAYYEQKITFSVQVIHTEYSREFGEKIFNNQYKTKRIDYDLFTTGKNHYHSSHIYSSNTKEKVIQFSGINQVVPQYIKDKYKKCYFYHQLVKNMIKTVTYFLMIIKN